MSRRFAGWYRRDTSGTAGVCPDPVEGDPVEGDPVEGGPVEGDPLEGGPVDGDPLEGHPVEEDLVEEDLVEQDLEAPSVYFLHTRVWGPQRMSLRPTSCTKGSMVDSDVPLRQIVENKVFD